MSRNMFKFGAFVRVAVSLGADRARAFSAQGRQTERDWARVPLALLLVEKATV